MGAVKEANSTGPKSLKLVQSKPWGKRVARITIFMLLLFIALMFVPWQQQVIGKGQVFVFDPDARPQTVEAQISGRVDQWLIKDGDMVEKGQRIGLIRDIDSKFLDPELVPRMMRQMKQLEVGRDAEIARLKELESQRAKIEGSRVQQIRNARERLKQAQDSKVVLDNIVRAAQQSLRIAKEVATMTASERKRQAEFAVTQAEQALQAAVIKLKNDRVQRERIAYLFNRGLSSKRDDELAENELANSEASVERGRLAVRIAKSQTNVNALGIEQARIEINRAQAQVDSARAAVEVAKANIATANNDIARIDFDTAERVVAIQASMQSAQSTIAKNNEGIEKLGMDLANLRERRNQAVLIAPASGQIVDVVAVGTGSTVKSGDVLARIVPTSNDRSVELYVTDNDVAFISKNRKVRLTFAGYPAVNFSGLPQLGVGTFGGTVYQIDPVDDGTASFRVIVKPDRHTLVGGRQDSAWPRSDVLRPGAEAVGWIMLDTVPLGFELWRQFNGFPPRKDLAADFRVNPSADKKSDKSKKYKVDKADSQDYLSPEIKVKSKK